MDKYDMTVVICLIGLLAIIFFMIAIGEKYSCYEQTKRIGYNHNWGLFSGCMIEKKPGQWIPLDVYRGFEE